MLGYKHDLEKRLSTVINKTMKSWNRNMGIVFDNKIYFGEILF